MHVWLGYARRRYVTMADMGHGLATLNSHNLVVYGQKNKVCIRFLS